MKSYVHEWKCIPAEGYFVRDLVQSLLQSRPLALAKMSTLVQYSDIYTYAYLKIKE